jgi:hypothetical protein
MFQRTNHFINKRLQTQAINDENKTSLRDIFEDIFIYKVSIKEHISRVLWNCAALYFFWPNYVKLLKPAN